MPVESRRWDEPGVGSSMPADLFAVGHAQSFITTRDGFVGYWPADHYRCKYIGFDEEMAVRRQLGKTVALVIRTSMEPLEAVVRSVLVNRDRTALRVVFERA